MSPLERLHTRALALAGAAVAEVRPGQLDLPTPCAGWTLGRLLAHVVGQHRGFAAAAWGAGPDLAHWRDAPLGDDPAGAFRSTAEQLTAAFAAAGTAPGPVRLWLPEISTATTVPLTVAVGFHLLDTAVHGWDVAAALGTGPEFVAGVQRDGALAEAVLRVAAPIPAGPEDRGPGRAFREPRAADPAAGPFERALGLLGRDPGWRQ